MSYEEDRDRVVMGILIENKARYVAPTTLVRIMRKTLDITDRICGYCGLELKGRSDYFHTNCYQDFCDLYDYNRVIDHYRWGHKFCEECLKKGLEVKTEEIHHIIPIKADGGNGNPVDPHNLIALCHECHLAYHKAYKYEVQAPQREQAKIEFKEWRKKNPSLEEFL